MLCVFLSTTPAKKMVFRVKVEEYAKLRLTGSGQVALKGQTSSVYAWVAASQKTRAYPLDCVSPEEIDQRGGLVSCPQIYASEAQVAPLTSLVINLRDGKISSFAWDSGCAGCGHSDCMHSSKSLDIHSHAVSEQTFQQGTCGVEVSSCAAGGACDLNVLVTWAGTDSRGRHLTSAGLRLSKWTGTTARSVYDGIVR